MKYDFDNIPAHKSVVRVCLLGKTIEKYKTGIHVFNHKDFNSWILLLAGLVFSDDDEGRQEAKKRLDDLYIILKRAEIDGRIEKVS